MIVITQARSALGFERSDIRLATQIGRIGQLRHVRPSRSPVILRQSTTIQSSCCADPILVLINRPRNRPHLGLDGGTCGGRFSED